MSNKRIKQKEQRVPLPRKPDGHEWPFQFRTVKQFAPLEKSLRKRGGEMEHAKSEHRILPQKVDGGENRAHHMTNDGK